jgi:drug/metabolite transporter (DMT)-like permease
MALRLWSFCQSIVFFFKEKISWLAVLGTALASVGMAILFLA